MSDPKWEKVKNIFQTALEKPSGAAREAYLNEVCGKDENLREEVLELLVSFDEAEDFLDEPPIAEVAETIVGKHEGFKLGQNFGRYLIERKLGAGGVGEVYLVRDNELERFAALKILSAQFSENPTHVRRFLQEARAASALNHPNILTIYESGQIDSVRFIAAEFVEGETLRERMRRAPFDLNEILEIVAQTAAALNAAHAAGIVHRDIKPENIMIRADGLVKVLDFGLAKLVEKESSESGILKKTEFKTVPGLVMGTVAYMSPEQARGLPTDERTDIWSFGVCLSESVFGVQPFSGETASDQIAAILRNNPEPQTQNAPHELCRIIEKCLEKQVENRYQTVGDFLTDLNDWRNSSDFPMEKLPIFPANKTIFANAKKTGEDSRNALSNSLSSAEYIVNGIKKHKFYTLVLSVFAVAALSLILYFTAIYPKSSAEQIRSIAVLPFVNAGNDADSEYLSDGLSESLINKLSRLPQLKIASRSSAFQYKNKTSDTQEIARALNVEAIVNGRIVKRGDDLQISVELINAVDNTQIWGETYNRKVSDAQKIQEDIAQKVLQKISFNPSETETKNFNSPITNNAQAYQLYLNGVFFRRKNGIENVKKAIEYQNQAISLDPNFALAYAEVGYNYYIFVGSGAVDSQTGLPPARQAIEKALSLNDSLAEAHDINSRLKTAEFDWNGAETEIRRAIELNPNLASAHTFYSELLTETKRFDEALTEIRKARELDPLRINLVNYEGEILFRARRFDDALELFENGNPEAVNETFALIIRARILAAKKRYSEAISMLKRSLEKDETTKGLIHLGRIYAITGERQQAFDLLKRLQELDQLKKEPDKYVSPAEFAILYSALGKHSQALDFLERAFSENDLSLPFINVEPEYDDLRGDPRFAALTKNLNLTSD